MDIISDKIRQAWDILDELDVDLWLIFVRETSLVSDPTLHLVVGGEVTWQSCFAFSRDSKAVALVGNLDKSIFVSPGRFDEVMTYTDDITESVRELISRFDPSQIAVNYSIGNPASDGLTHGMYLVLKKYLRGTPYVKRLISSEPLVSRLRARKLPSEIKRLSAAAKMAVEAWDESVPQISIGMTERQVAAVIDEMIFKRGGNNSFSTIVNAGDKTDPGHGQPTNAKLDAGDLLHVDFGIELDGFCSDLQRLVYFRHRNEDQPPPELTEAFEVVRDIISESSKICRPGARGYQVDRQARENLRDLGYPEYQHALGHQLGRAVHDGGAIIGPRWAKYGSSPTTPLEAGNVFTLELEINLPGIGCVGLEEDICVTKSGGRFLCPRQLELIVK